MAYVIRVECINKTNRSNAYERIRAIGGRNPDGRPWMLTEDQRRADEIHRHVEVDQNHEPIPEPYPVSISARIPSISAVG